MKTERTQIVLVADASLDLKVLSETEKTRLF